VSNDLVERQLDQALEATFPASDPVALTPPKDDFEPRTELNQPAGGLPVLIANCAAKARL
jgi:hypothetical protein